MNNFEEKLSKLEQLTENIKKSDISLEEALKTFEEGIKLANGMEKEIDKIEGKIQQLMKEPNPIDGTGAELDLFSQVDETGSSGKPSQGTRQ